MSFRPYMRGLLGSAAVVSAFDPASLFASGEQGAWYDPSDLTTLYQDSAGTAAVTADGDPVGLMFDKSQGLVNGPNLFVSENVTLGDWIETAGGYSFDSATANLDDGYDAMLLSVPAGKRYWISFDIVVDGTDLLLRKFPGGIPNTLAELPSGSYLLALDSGTGGFEFRRTTAQNVSFEITNVVARELPGNHATQSTSAVRPVYRTDGTLHWLEFDGVDDVLIGTNAYDKAAFSYCSAFEQTDQTGLHAIIKSFESTSKEWASLDVDSGTLALNVDNSDLESLFIKALSNSTRYVAVADHVTSSGVMRGFVNGVLENSRTIASKNQINGEEPESIGGETVSGSQFFKGRQYQCLHIDRVLTTEERQDLESFFAAKSGVVL